MHFFVKELPGEEPPSLATLQLLHQRAADLLARRPWDLLDESELVLLREPICGELCHCSVMGALGQVRALHAYLGPESYRLFKKLESGAATTLGEFLSGQHSVYVEFVPSAELETADRKLLTALGQPLKKATIAPMFRTIRPGYHPWYVTEAEAKILSDCLQAAIAICELLEENEDLDYWDQEGVYPLLSREGEDETEDKYDIELVEVADPPTPILEPAKLDEARVGRVRDSHYPSNGIVELDHFYGGGMIGKKDERKACFRMAMVINSKTAHAYPPEVLLPSASTGDALASAALRAIETARALPREIRVRQSTFKSLLEPLAKELGFPVRVVKSLPALDHAKEHLLRLMGDPGSIEPL